MRIHKAGSRPTRRANPDYFTGTVWQDVVAEPEGSARAAALFVHFEPGARTNWHTHPHGQTIHVLSGICRAQLRGEPVVELHPGDAVFFPPETEHWHGAAPHSAMTHLAIQEADGGVTAHWLEPVSETDYTAI